MLGIANNPNAIVLYFCDKSENVSPYFEGIPLEQKSLRKLDYQQDVVTLLKNYHQSHDIAHLQQVFERIVVMGEGYGAYIANQIATQYGLRALLINPTIYSQGNPPFALDNQEQVEVLIEQLNSSVAKEDYEQLFKYAPQNWSIDYMKSDCFGVMQSLQISIADLCNCAWSWIDDGVWYGED